MKKVMNMIVVLLLILPIVFSAPLSEATSNLSTTVGDPIPTPVSSGSGHSSGGSSAPPATTENETVEFECSADKKITCNNGTEVIKFKCVDGEYHSTGDVCLNYECTQAETYTCFDDREIITKACIENKWVVTNETCQDQKVVILPPEKNPNCKYGHYEELLGGCAYPELAAQITLGIIVLYCWLSGRKKDDEAIDYQDRSTDSE